MVGWSVGRVVCNALTLRAPMEHLKLSHGCKSRICGRQGHYHPSQCEFEPLGCLAWGDREQTSKSTTVSHAKIYTYNTHSPPSAVMAEWLRRRARNLLGYRRAGSNLVRSGSFSIFFFFFLYRQHIICALTPHVLTSLHIVLGTQGQVHALDTSGAYLGKPCLLFVSFWVHLPEWTKKCR